MCAREVNHCEPIRGSVRGRVEVGSVRVFRRGTQLFRGANHPPAAAPLILLNIEFDRTNPLSLRSPNISPVPAPTIWNEDSSGVIVYSVLTKRLTVLHKKHTVNVLEGFVQVDDLGSGIFFIAAITVC